MGMVYGDLYSTLFHEASGNLPPGLGLNELWEYPAARDFVGELLLKPGFIEKMRFVPDSLWDKGGIDDQVRSILTEALVSTSALITSEDFRGALFRSLRKVWARFSQRIKTAIAEAEAKKDAELQAQRMKEYLDVQRKMKEFSSFYDEE